MGDASVSDAKAILLDGAQTAEQYLQLMPQSPPSPESWGGESELHMMAILWKCRICTLFFRQDPVEDSQVRLLAGPLGTTGHIHTLLFNGSHYDLVILTQVQNNIGLAAMSVPSVRPSLVTGFGAALISPRTLRHVIVDGNRLSAPVGCR